MPYRNEQTNSAPATPRGRPRDPVLEQRILDAVGALLAEKGYDAVTVEEVARRSGASKASLYRRWSTKRDMVIASLRAGPTHHAPGVPIDTGSLRGDLIALCERLDETLRAADSRAAMLLLQAGLEDPELCEAIETAVGPTGARLPASVIAAAEQRGELPAGTDPFAFDEVVGSVLLLRRVNGLLVDDEHLAALVDTIVLPALHASARAAAPLPSGIFSGHPAPHPQETP